MTRFRVFLRHGIFSNKSAMEPLEHFFKTRSLSRQCLSVSNQSYDWGQDVIKSGIELAEQVKHEVRDEASILLVGHSQGGLVCRVAATYLKGTARNGEATAGRLNHSTNISNSIGVVTAGTPNAGAITMGQLSVNGKLLLSSARALQRMGKLGFQNLTSLTTEYLFEVLQHWSVDAKYLSFSGSAGNRYSAIDPSLVPPLFKLSVLLEKPNDYVVEDCSVDLNQALIPPEIDDLEANYRHVRTYIDAVHTNHSGVKETPLAGEIIEKSMVWLLQ